MPNFKIKLFADGANKEEMLRMNQDPLISGFTTNPTLMREAGVSDYVLFAKELLAEIKEKPISFEVFADEPKEMERQARLISSWGENVYVKIPITNTQGASNAALIERLSKAGVKVNVTAMMTLEQVKLVVEALAYPPASYVSIFAGRIADSGRDPMPIMESVVKYLKSYPKTELIWASSREVLNVVQANSIGCHIITLTSPLINKIKLIGKDLIEFSLDTVKMFYDDAKKAGYEL